MENTNYVINTEKKIYSQKKTRLTQTGNHIEKSSDNIDFLALQKHSQFRNELLKTELKKLVKIFEYLKTLKKSYLKDYHSGGKSHVSLIKKNMEIKIQNITISISIENINNLLKNITISIEIENINNLLKNINI
jgi:hypothetical protein